MPTGDGLLVRVHPIGGVVTAAALRALAAAARAHGNGLVDVTSRANLQVRGVTETSHPALAAALDAAGLGDPRPGAGPQRLTLTDPFDAGALAAALEATAPAGLPPKTLVAVESGIALDPEADLRLAAVSGIVAIGLASTGGTDWVGAVPEDEAAGVARAILEAFAATGARRLRDLDPGTRRALSAGLRLGPVRAPAPGRPLEPGIATVGKRFALVTELPFGRADAALLEAAAGWAERRGDGLVRTTHRRGLAFAGLDAAGAEALAGAAHAAGLILDPADPRRRLAACPGAPACARGTTPTQDDAARLAAAAGRLGLGIHVSGCAKGCAHPGPAALTLVGEAGGYGVVLNGSATDPAPPRSFAAILDALARADHASRLADLLGGR